MIEEGIREVVLFLRSKGFETLESCQGRGYDDRVHPHNAWVAVNNDAGKTAEETRCRLENVLIAEGYRNFSTYIKHHIIDGVARRRTINVDFGGAINANIHNTDPRWDQLSWEYLGLAEGFDLFRIVPVEGAKELYEHRKQQGCFDYVPVFKEIKSRHKR